MADLPPDRVQSNAAFTFCGVDIFGPRKSYRVEVLGMYFYMCVLSSCLFGNSQFIDYKFLNQRLTQIYSNYRTDFIASRCDQGTNFLGAKSELSLS